MYTTFSENNTKFMVGQKCKYSAYGRQLDMSVNYHQTGVWVCHCYNNLYHVVLVAYGKVYKKSIVLVDTALRRNLT